MADVLIVDDEAPIREMLSVHVDMARYTFREAENGQDALNLLRERVSDVVVLDLMMPVMDGLETCRQIRANPRTAMAYVIMLTAKDSVDDRVAGLDMGADAYMTKPFEPDELMAQIRVGIRSFWERQSSLTDPLTNLFNGRTFTAFMEMEVSRSERAGTDLSLVFFEVDNLQSINEENGPAEGDRVLRQVGEILTANSRAGDVISHWGNERFAWLLPQCGKNEASVALKRVLEKLDECDFGEGLSINHLSGVVDLKEREKPSAFVRRGEQELYRDGD